MSLRSLPLAVALMAGCAAPRPTAVGALVVVDGTVAVPDHERTACVDPAPIHRALIAEGGVRWNLHPFASLAAAPATASRLVDQMEADYLAANFAGCHATNLLPELALERLLGAHDVRSAVRAALYGAACARKLGADFLPFAEGQLRFVLAKDELDAMGELARSKVVDPDYRDYVEQLHGKVSPIRLWTTVAVTPPGATISINGVPRTCEHDRCRIQATAGDTIVITAERFGYARYVATLEAGKTGDFALYSVDRETEHQVAAAIQRRDKAPYHACASAQVAAAPVPLIGGTAPSLDAIGEAAARGLAAKIVLLVDVRATAATAMVYDQALRRIVARRAAAGTGRELAPRVSREALRAWREKTATHWYTSWKFWAGVAVVGAAASGGAVYYFKENDYVVRPAL